MIDTTTLAWTILPQVGISLVSWIQVILSLNMYKGLCCFSRQDAFALGLYMIAAGVRVVAGGAAAAQVFVIQLTSAIISTLITYAGFILIFNQTWNLPTRQQVVGGLFIILPTSLWEVHTRLVVQMR